MEYLRIPKDRQKFKQLVRRLLKKEREIWRKKFYRSEDNLIPIDKVLLMFRPQDRERVIKIYNFYYM